MSDVRITPQPWLWQPRTQTIRLIEIHSTRGGSASPLTDYNATCNWMANRNNGSPSQGWGGSCSRILGPDGQMCIVLDDNQMPTYCAGYGGTGTWAIDEYGKAYEWAQPNRDTPYSDAMYRRGAKEIALDCKANGIPPVFLEIWDQRGPVPTGLVRHDRCENGVKLGKSDPGAQFDEARFLSYLNAELQTSEEDDMDAIQDERLKKIENALYFPVPFFADRTNTIPAWQAMLLVYKILTDDVDPGVPDNPRFAAWASQLSAASIPEAAADAKAFVAELGKTIQAGSQADT